MILLYTLLFHSVFVVLSSNSSLNPPIFASFTYEQGSDAISVVENNEITTIHIYDNMIISMDIIIHSIYDDFCQNVFHIGNSKKFENYPSIFIDKNINAQNGFKIRVTNDDNIHHTFKTKNPIELDTNYHIKITYTQNALMINLNFLPIVSETNFGKHSLRPNNTVTVYAGDPWHQPANAKITNLKIYGWNDNYDIDSSKKTQFAIQKLYKKHLSDASMLGIFVGVILLFLIASLCYLNCFSFKKYKKAKEEFQNKVGTMNKNEIINLKIKNMKNKACHNFESENEMDSFDLYV